MTKFSSIHSESSGALLCRVADDVASEGNSIIVSLFLVVRHFPSTYAMISHVGWLRSLIVAAKSVESDDFDHGEQSVLTLR